MKRRYEIKHPLHLQTMIGMSAYLVGQLLLIYSSFTRNGFNPLFYFVVILLVFSLTITVYLILRRMAKPSEIRMLETTMDVRGHEVDAKNVDCIMIDGYFQPVVGIRPKGRKIVPGQFTFSFHVSGNDDEAMKALKGWAEHNQIQIYNRKFLRWI
ncbi:hypothetical protein [Paenibacillus radicis (ex Gao et al. 2016)]|uniref:Uncharacterized protein n=1 Tax=Paenibacillus radicis (ex Gao et al. 2016) TaxID=1737354 RepID=A0A917HQ45_9BACL|nr:hypothetical protein [Paenibacillus radicis (ex Gao et al. 2016)]GGG85431.1 hypothetical protein GCM10010918_49240 [Paenibacillus radicis (ex Gao et al. 2016)]